jgi:hypothetical protein
LEYHLQKFYRAVITFQQMTDMPLGQLGAEEPVIFTVFAGFETGFDSSNETITNGFFFGLARRSPTQYENLIILTKRRRTAFNLESFTIFSQSSFANSGSNFFNRLFGILRI